MGLWEPTKDLSCFSIKLIHTNSLLYSMYSQPYCKLAFWVSFWDGQDKHNPFAVLKSSKIMDEMRKLARKYQNVCSFILRPSEIAVVSLVLVKG